MTSAEQTCYTLIHVPNDSEQPKEDALKESFEKGRPLLWSVLVYFLMGYREDFIYVLMRMGNCAWLDQEDQL